MKLLAFLIAIAFPVSAFAASAPSVDRSPRRYEAISSVVFQYRWLKFSALGVISVDARKRNFALVGLSQIGINIFELSNKNGVIRSHMPGTLLKRNPRLATGAVSDVNNMFLDLAPRPGAKLRDTGALEIFTEQASSGILEYRFDKSTGLLAEKRFSLPCKFPPGRTVIWVARYQDYAKQRGWTYANFVSLKNRKLHYAISTRVREIRILK
jgi:hypothetical protein